MRKHTRDARINREKPCQAETAALLTVCPAEGGGTEDSDTNPKHDLN